MSLPGADDDILAETLRALPAIPERARTDVVSLLSRAERHGLGGVMADALRDARVHIEPVLDTAIERREAARELDHAAHLAQLHGIDDVFDRAGIAAIALKGALFAQRYYPRPAARATSDVDILVSEADLDRAVAALGKAGYVAADGPEEQRFRREHHHLHLSHAAALPLELHFHAYRGFGRVLRSEPLLARRVGVSSLRAIGVLTPEDELLFLVVHAAAHRFVRLGWLFDLRLLLATMSQHAIEIAAGRALELGFARPVAFAAGLLVDVLGVDPEAVRPLGPLEPLRNSIARSIVAEPVPGVRRSATRFVYTVALCDTVAAASRYAVGASVARTRRALRIGR
jgi:hypothetical protein